MSHTPLIPLPLFIPGETIYKPGDSTLYYTNDGKVMVPPELFPSKCNNLCNYLKKEECDADGYILTESGDMWAKKFWPLFPFVRSERDGVGRPVPCDITSDGKVQFVNIMVELFGGATTSPFGAAITKDAEVEMVRRCKENSMKRADGTDPTSIEDVHNIIKSLKGKPDHLVFNYIFNWISSLTMDSGLQWMHKSIRNHLRSKAPFLELPPDDSFPSTISRHFLVRLADKKSVQTIKEEAKTIQQQNFNKVLKLDAVVHSKASPGTKQYDQYQRQLNDPCVSIVEFKDQTYVTKTRLKSPLYVLVSPPSNSNIGIASLHITNAINASPDTPLPEFIKMVTLNYRYRNATQNQSSSNIGDDDTPANETSGPITDVTNDKEVDDNTAAPNDDSGGNLHTEYLNSIPSVEITTTTTTTDPTGPDVTATSTADDNAPKEVTVVAAPIMPSSAIANSTGDGTEATVDVSIVTGNTPDSCLASTVPATIPTRTDQGDTFSAVTDAVPAQTATSAAPSLSTCVTQDQGSVDDSSEKEYVENQIYYACNKPSCQYVSCEPCYDHKSNEALVENGRGRATTRKGRKRQHTDAHAQELTCVNGCPNNPFCLVRQNEARYFKHDQMERQNRFKCSICGKYFKETL